MEKEEEKKKHWLFYSVEILLIKGSSPNVKQKSSAV